MRACLGISSTGPKLINNKRAREVQSIQSKVRRINNKAELILFPTTHKIQMKIMICMTKSILQRKKETDFFPRSKINMRVIPQKKGKSNQFNSEDKIVLIRIVMEDWLKDQRMRQAARKFLMTLTQMKDNYIKNKTALIEKEMKENHKNKKYNKMVKKTFRYKKKLKWEKKDIRIIKMEERVNKYNIILKVGMQKNSNQVTQQKY